MKLKERQEQHWNTFNLIPNEREGYEPADEAEYFYKMLCHKYSGGSLIEGDKLFKEYSLVDLYEKMMNTRADNW